MKRRRTLYTLTQCQINFGCVLTDTPMTIPEIIRKANKEASDMQKAHWIALVDLGIAERCYDRFGGISLKRGPEWRAFYQLYGEENVRRGLEHLEILEELKDFEMPKADVIHFPGWRLVKQVRHLRLIIR